MMEARINLWVHTVLAWGKWLIIWIGRFPQAELLWESESKSTEVLGPLSHSLAGLLPGDGWDDRLTIEVMISERE